jgi:hypothetical protein
VDSLYASSEPVIEQLHHELVSHLEIPLLNHPKEFAFPSDRFYDTGYHLNQEAGEARTRFIAAAIERERLHRPAITLAKRR